MANSIFDTPQWTDCLSDNNGKRPRVNPARPTTGLSYREAVERAALSAHSKHYGFIFSKADPYIGLDVDVDPKGIKTNATPTIPEAITLLLQTHPTHCHFSPNGHGLHIIYKVCPPGQGLLNSQGRAQGACSIANGAIFNGDWRWDRSFLTFTDNKHPLCAPIATIDLETLESIIGPITTHVLPTTEDTPAPLIDISTGLRVQAHIPAVSDIVRTLKDVPSSLNTKAQKACSYLKHSAPTNNYEYWVLVGQACAHAAISLSAFGDGQQSTSEITQAFVTWSAKDESAFPGQDEVRKKFQLLLASTEEKIRHNIPTATYKVLVTLARRSTANFPVLYSQALIPDPRSIKNYEYLLEHDELSIFQDTMAGGFTIVGPEETIAEWFCPAPGYLAPRKTGSSQVLDNSTLSTVMLPYLQNRFKQSLSPAQASMCTKHFTAHAQQTSMFKDWIDSTPWDGVPRLEKVCKSITFADEEYADLYESYIRKSLLAMIGIHYWPQDHPKIPAMLILKGPQRTFKSSWAEWLIPPELNNLLGMADTETLLTGATERDRLLSTRAIVVVNECEPMFNPRYEQRIKACVDQESVTYRDLYAPNHVTRQRTALLIGTTNKSDLYTGTLGSRKIWQIPVALCDSMLILNMNKQQLFAEIKSTLIAYKKANPDSLIQDTWFQTDEELDRVEQINRDARGVQGIDALLVEVFGQPEFDVNDYVVDYKVQFRRGDAYSLENRPNCWRITSLLRYMKDRFPDDFIDRKALAYAAARYCEHYTNTKNKTANIFGQTRSIKMITRGTHDYSSTERLYLFPVPQK